MINKEKILVLTSSFPEQQNSDSTNGSFVLKLCLELAENFEIFIVTPHIPGSEKTVITDDFKIFRHKQTIFNKKSIAGGAGIMGNLKKSPILYLQLPFFLLFQVIKVIQIIRKENIKIIHAHWLFMQGLTALISLFFFRRKQIKLITTVHGGDIWSLKGKFGTFLKRIVIKKSAALTVVSNAIKEAVNNILETDKIYTYPMGVETEYFHKNKFNSKIKNTYNIHGKFLLFVGRFVQKKGVPFLIESFKEVNKIFPDSKLIIVGHGIMENELKKLTQDLMLSENIIFPGKIKPGDIAPYFATADIFIGPSIVAQDGDAEGFGLVFAEAASCETYVITTDFPAIADIIKDNQTGFTVRQKDSEHLAEKIIYVLENFDKLDHIRKNARKHVADNFDWKKVGENYSNLYKKLLNDE